MVSFEDEYPIIVKEWDYDKNKELEIYPNEVAPHSNKKVWWICPICDYSYQAAINNRSNGTACPRCSRESKTSFGEQALFFYINKIVSAENRWNTIGAEADIFISSMNLSIEYDGQLYHSSKESDIREKEKYKYFKENQIKLIRVKENFNNTITKENADYTLEIKSHNFDIEIPKIIDQILCIINSIFWTDFEIDVDLKRDRQYIYQQYITQRKENSVANKPELLNDWDFEKNKIKPECIFMGSNKKVWWKCKHGHSYEQQVNSHTKGNGCPYCAEQKVLKGFNDLLTKYPEIAKEWDYKKNEIGPDQVLPFSNKKYYWICSNNHEYETSPSKRCRSDRPTKCPYCSNKKLLRGYNDLKTLRPDLAKQWDYDKNEKRPEDYFIGSDYKAWWICSKGHSFNSYIYSRTGKKNAGCPICANKKVLEGYNDLKTLRPDLLVDWDYQKNEFGPENYVTGSNKVVYWKCHECGREWNASVNSRCNSGNGCKSCSMKKAWSFLRR